MSVCQTTSPQPSAGGTPGAVSPSSVRPPRRRVLAPVASSPKQLAIARALPIPPAAGISTGRSSGRSGWPSVVEERAGGQRPGIYEGQQHPWRHGRGMQQQLRPVEGLDAGDPLVRQVGRQPDVEVQPERYGDLVPEEAPEGAPRGIGAPNQLGGDPPGGDVVVALPGSGLPQGSLAGDQPATSLRERKKQRTRRTIQAQALRLFTDKGVQATTIEEIAAAADVAPRTLFRYLPTKEEIVFWSKYPPTLAGFVSARPADEPAVHAVRHGIVDGLNSFYDQDREQQLERLRLAFRTPALQPRMRQQQAHWADELAEILAPPPRCAPGRPGNPRHRRRNRRRRVGRRRVLAGAGRPRGAGCALRPGARHRARWGSHWPRRPRRSNPQNPPFRPSTPAPCHGQDRDSAQRAAPGAGQRISYRSSLASRRAPGRRAQRSTRCSTDSAPAGLPTISPDNEAASYRRVTGSVSR
jgi:AcrR family transcriptional regulator